MTQVLEALQQAVTDAAEKVGPAVVGLGPRLGPRLGRGVRARPGPDRRARAARRRGGGDVRRRRRAEGRVLGVRPRPRRGGDRRRHRRRASRRVGAGERRRPPARRCSRSPTPAGAGCARPSGSCPRPGAASAARAGAGSPARSSTPRRSRAAPPAARWWTWTGNLLGLNAVRRDGGFILALPADAALRRGRRAGPRRGGRAAAAGRRARAAARRAPHARRRRARPSATACSCATWSTDSPAARRRRCSAATCSSAPATGRSRAWTTCSTRSTARATRCPRASCAAREERELEFELTQLQFVKSCDILRFRAELRLSRLPYRRHRLRQVDAARDPRPRGGPLALLRARALARRASRRARSRCACGRSRRRASSSASTFPEVPPRVEYALTEKGRALVPIVESMRVYGREWLNEDGALRRRAARDALRSPPSPPEAFRPTRVLAIPRARGRRLAARGERPRPCTTAPCTTRWPPSSRRPRGSSPRRSPAAPRCPSS